MTDTRTQVRITQSNNGYSNVRFWDDSGSAYIDLDSEAIDYDQNATAFNLWNEVGVDHLFIGKTSKFSFIGFRAGTVGSYDNFIYQYSNVGGPYNIVAVSAIAHWFKFSGDQTSRFTVGTLFTVSGSTGNDADYLVTAISYVAPNTKIDVANVPSAIADGNINTIWTQFDLIHDDTAAWSKSGYLSFAQPADWGTDIDIDSVEDNYWIRIKALTITTTAQAFHLMPMVESKPPVFLKYMMADKSDWLLHDINQDVQSGDIRNKTPIFCEIDCVLHCFPHDNLILLYYLFTSQSRIFVEDLAQTSPPDWDNDSIIKSFEGGFDNIPGAILAVKKRDMSDYTLSCKIDNVITLTTVIGLSQ